MRSECDVHNYEFSLHESRHLVDSQSRFQFHLNALTYLRLYFSLFRVEVAYFIFLTTQTSESVDEIIYTLAAPLLIRRCARRVSSARRDEYDLI